MITSAWVLPLPSLTVQGSVGTSLSKPGAALFPAQLVSRIAQSGTGASTPQRSPYRAIGNHAPGPSRPARAGHRAEQRNERVITERDRKSADSLRWRGTDSNPWFGDALAPPTVRRWCDAA